MLSLVEISPAVFEKIFEVRQCIFAISLLSPLPKKRGFSFEFPPPKDALCQVCVQLALRILEEDENVKS